MTDRFHVDAYVGTVHDRSDSLANDAWVAFTRLIKSGSTTTSIDREERGAVPTIRHASRPDLYASVSVDRYSVDGRRKGVTIGVMPTVHDQLRTSVRIIFEDAGSLFDDDALDEDVASLVLEVTAVHLAKAIQRHLDSVPDAKRSDGHEGPENVFELTRDADAVSAALRDASIAALGADGRTGTKIALPTPWTPLRAMAGRVDVETDAEISARLPTVLSLSTAFAFSDGNGRGTSGTIKIGSVIDWATVVGPMERLRAMNDARNDAAAA